MKRTFFLLIALFAVICGEAQNQEQKIAENGEKIVLSGTVRDERSGASIAQASVSATGTSISVVTNEDGFFTLKADRLPQGITISCIGYQSRQLTAREASKSPLNIKLKPTAIALDEVVVWTGNPRELVRIAVNKIPENYSRTPELYQGFYRETAMKRNRYIYVAEGVIDMYKTSYSHTDRRDRVAIRKGRRLLSPKKSDTLSVKVTGGPLQPIQLDIAKNPDILLSAAELANYDFEVLSSTTINDRLQYVVGLKPRVVAPYPLYYGRLYIDREKLAITRAELSLDMSNRDKVTDMILVRKPAGVKFKPKELVTLVDYRYENGVTRLNYIRNTFRFNCDWKRRLLATSFTACCEMVVTDHNPASNSHPISGRDSFDSRDAFYDKVDFFRDPKFWEDYNIIEPSESLDNAIERLVKKQKK
ncbi:MAG: carboxypeptidase-like regulatory domain-containing protein [Prevotella sp.]|nr:carboxypeptidase-like regulatory domain-containing protein [Prevotella sp.]